MDRVLVNQGARGRLASDSLKDFSNLALASLSLTNTTGLGSGIRRPVSSCVSLWPFSMTM